MLKRSLCLLFICISLPVTLRVACQVTTADTVCAGQTRHYYVDPDPGSTYSWHVDGLLQAGLNDNEFDFTRGKDNIYLLEVQEYSAEGCPGPVRTEMVVVIQCPVLPDEHLSISKAFSPNGDLINDVWNIGNAGLYPDMEITIYNRWGQQIWKSARGYPIPWDGRSRGADLPIDSYHYLIDLHNGTGPIIGTVTIVR